MTDHGSSIRGFQTSKPGTNRLLHPDWQRAIGTLWRAPVSSIAILAALMSRGAEPIAILFEKVDKTAMSRHPSAVARARYRGWLLPRGVVHSAGFDNAPTLLCAK